MIEIQLPHLGLEHPDYCADSNPGALLNRIMPPFVFSLAYASGLKNRTGKNCFSPASLQFCPVFIREQEFTEQK
ncbi:MAG: hypothetical protein PHE06_14640 [Lachnospiraceae bacterium]|nr:hypothetical protein [Lachnospiraceae bacterium]